MNKQNQWLFEAPVITDLSLNQGYYSNSEWKAEWKLRETNPYAIGEQEWETVGSLRIPKRVARGHSQNIQTNRLNIQATSRSQTGRSHSAAQISANQRQIGKVPKPANSFQSTLFQHDADLLSVLHGQLRLGRTGDPQYPAPIKSQGSAVAKVQKALVELSYLPPTYSIDGKYGNETYNAVLNYKRKYGIRTETGYLDGIVGPKTIRHLDNALYERKTTVNVVVRDNNGRLISSPLVIVRLRDIQTGTLLGEQRAISPRLTFVIDQTNKAGRRAFQVETDGDPRFWPWKAHVIQSASRKSLVNRESEDNSAVQAIVPRLRDITGSKDDLVDAGAQTGRVPPEPLQTSCGYTIGKSPLPLLPILKIDPNACGTNRLRTVELPRQEALRGTLRILSATPETAPAKPPSLFLLWIPDGLNLSAMREKGFDFHVHFHPVIGADIPTTLNYPLGRRATSGGRQEQPYIGKGYSYLLWRTSGAYQHDLAQRTCIYVVPVASRALGFSQLTATKLFESLQEIAVLVDQFIAQASSSTRPPVGKVALSGFSAGGATVGQVLSRPGDKKGQDFLNTNVEEVYFFDLPAKAAQTAAPIVKRWQQHNKNSVVRSYTEYSDTHREFVPLVKTSPSDLQKVLFKGANAPAEEVNSVKGSAVFIPADLLLPKGCTSQDAKCKIPIAASIKHDWFVQFFMAHALEASRFDRL